MTDFRNNPVLRALRSEGSNIRITSPEDKEGFNLEKMIVVSRGKRWLGEAGSILNDPAETKQNEQLGSDTIKKII